MLAAKLCENAVQFGLDPILCNPIAFHDDSCVELMHSLDITNVRETICNELGSLVHLDYDLNCSNDSQFVDAVCSETTPDMSHVNLRRLVDEDIRLKDINKFYEDLRSASSIYNNFKTKPTVFTDAWALKMNSNDEFASIVSLKIDMFDNYVSNPANVSAGIALREFKKTNENAIAKMIEIGNFRRTLSYFAMNHPTASETLKSQPNVVLLYRFHYLYREYLANKPLIKELLAHSKTTAFFEEFEPILFPKSNIFSGSAEMKTDAEINDAFLSKEMDSLVSSVSTWAKKNPSTSRGEASLESFLQMLPVLILDDQLENEGSKLGSAMLELEQMKADEFKKASNGLSSPLFASNWIRKYNIELNTLRLPQKFDVGEVIQHFLTFLPGDKINVNEMYKNNKANFKPALDLKWKLSLFGKNLASMSLAEEYSVKSLVESFLHVSNAIARYMLDSKEKDFTSRREKLVTGKFFDDQKVNWVVKSPIDFPNSFPECEESYTSLLNELVSLPVKGPELPSLDEFKKACDEMLHLKDSPINSSDSLEAASKSIANVKLLKKRIMSSVRFIILTHEIDSSMHSKNYHNMFNTLTMLSTSSSISKFDRLPGVSKAYDSASLILQPVSAVFETVKSLSSIRTDFEQQMTSITHKWESKNSISAVMAKYLTLRSPSHGLTSLLLNALNDAKVLPLEDFNQMLSWHRDRVTQYEIDGSGSVDDPIVNDPLKSLYNSMSDGPTVSVVIDSILNVFTKKLVYIDETSVNALITPDILSLYNDLKMDSSKLDPFRAALSYDSIFRSFSFIMRNKAESILLEESKIAPFSPSVPVIDSAVIELQEFVSNLRHEDRKLNFIFSYIQIEPIYTAFIITDDSQVVEYKKSIINRFFKDVITEEQFNKVRGVFTASPSLNIEEEKKDILAIVAKMKSSWAPLPFTLLKRLIKLVPLNGISSMVYRALYDSFNKRNSGGLDENMLEVIKEWVWGQKEQNVSIAPTITSLLTPGNSFNFKAYYLVINTLLNVLDVLSEIDFAACENIFSSQERMNLRYSLYDIKETSSSFNLQMVANKMASFLKQINDQAFVDEYAEMFGPFYKSFKERTQDEFLGHKIYYHSYFNLQLQSVSRFLEVFEAFKGSYDYYMIDGFESGLTSALQHAESFRSYYYAFINTNFLLKAHEYYHAHHPVNEDEAFAAEFRGYYRLLHVCNMMSRTLTTFAYEASAAQTICSKLEMSVLTKGEFFTLPNKIGPLLSDSEENDKLLALMDMYKDQVRKGKHDLPDITGDTVKNDFTVFLRNWSVNELLLTLKRQNCDILTEVRTACMNDEELCTYFDYRTDNLLQVIRTVQTDNDISFAKRLISLVQERFSVAATLQIALAYTPGFDFMAIRNGGASYVESLVQNIPFFLPHLNHQKVIGTDKNRLESIFTHTSPLHTDLKELYNVAYSLLELIHIQGKFITSTFLLNNQELKTLNSQVFDGSYFDSNKPWTTMRLSAIPQEAIEYVVDLLPSAHRRITSLTRVENKHELSDFDTTSISIDQIDQLKDTLTSSLFSFSPNTDSDLQTTIDNAHYIVNKARQMSIAPLKSLILQSMAKSNTTMQALLPFFLKEEIQSVWHFLPLHEPDIDGVKNDVSLFMNFAANPILLNLDKAMGCYDEDYNLSKQKIEESINQIELFENNDHEKKSIDGKKFMEIISKIAANGLQFTIISDLFKVYGINHGISEAVNCLMDNMIDASNAHILCNKLNDIYLNNNEVSGTLAMSIYRFYKDVLYRIIPNSIAWTSFDEKTIEKFNRSPLYTANFNEIRSSFDLQKVNTEVSQQLSKTVKSMFNQLYPADSNSQPPTNATSEEKKQNSGLGAGAIFGIVFACLVAAGALSYLMYFLYIRHRNRKPLIYLEEELI